MRKALLTAKEIVKTYPGAQEPVLNHINTEIYGGDFTVIMGPSGATRRAYPPCPMMSESISVHTSGARGCDEAREKEKSPSVQVAREMRPPSPRTVTYGEDNINIK